MRATISLSDRDQIDTLSKRFEILKQQFDRGVAVQSVGSLEVVLASMSKFSMDISYGTIG
jgi:hypothetical protein